MLLEVALDVAADEFKDINYDDTVETTYSSEAAEEFLKEFPTAKIVVVIDTHSAESGFLLWKGKPRGDFETTPLLPVSPTPPLTSHPHGPSRSSVTASQLQFFNISLMKTRLRTIHTG